MKNKLYTLAVLASLAVGCAGPQKPAESTTTTTTPAEVETLDSTAMELDSAKTSIDKSVEDVKNKVNDLN